MAAIHLLRRRTMLAGLAAACCLPVAGPLVAAGDTIRIGVSGPFTGGSAPMGESMRNGIRLAVEEINAYGGLLGRKIELVERDDQANPEVGGKVADELINKEKVVATLGIVNTGVGLASIDKYQAAKVPIIIAVSTGAALTRKFAPPAAPENYVFRVSMRTDVEAAYLAEHMVRQKHAKVALLADSTPYGDAGKNDITKALGERGVSIVATERFNIGETDLTAQLQRGRDAGAQVIVAVGIGPELVAIAKGREKLKWNVPFTGTWPLSMQNFIVPAGKAGEGALMPQTFIQEGGNSRKNAFLLSYVNTYKTQIIPSPMSAAQGYDAVRLLFSAITQAGSTEGPKIREALENLRSPVYGVITTYDKPFNKQDHDAITQNMLVMGEVKGGRVLYAFQEDAKRSLVERKKVQ